MNISDAILTAAKIVVDDALAKVPYDRTIQAEIVKIENVDTGEYKIKYSGNTFSAFGQGETNYKIGQQVFVSVPEGDFSGRKLITGRVSMESLSDKQMTQLSNSYVPVGPGFDTMYRFNKSKEFGLNAQPDHAEVAVFTRMAEPNNLFQQYAKNYNLIEISADFLTQLYAEHTTGDYGIEVGFTANTADGKGQPCTYRLNLKDFNGRPYSYTVWATQKVIIKIQKDYLLSLDYIKFYQEGFQKDYQIYKDGRTEVIDDNNLFVRNVNLQFVERKDMSGSLYYLNIATPWGNSFSAQTATTEIELIGQLLYQGNNIYDSGNCASAWYKRDLSVMLNSPDYDRSAGVGWKKLEVTGNILKVSQSEVPHQAEYKLVVIYNEKVKTEQTISVYNLDSAYNISLSQETRGSRIWLTIQTGNPQDSLVGDWYLQYPDGRYEKYREKVTEIDITDLLIYSSLVFHCAVYNFAGTQVLANLQHGMFSSESEDDISVTFVGQDSYKYDATGDVPIEDTEKERDLRIELVWRDGYGVAYKTKWIGPDGQEIPTSGTYDPKESMMESMRFDSNTNIVYYKIKKKFLNGYNNNTLKVQINTVDGKEYTYSKEIIFTKDGDQGTNGTTYMVAVRPCSVDGVKLSGFNALHYNNGWGDSLRLRAFVYKDGEPLEGNTDYQLTYLWSYHNLTKVADNGTGTVVVNGGSRPDSENTSDLEYYVKVEVTVRETGFENPLKIYALYPVDVVVGANISNESVNISQIPLYIKYTASGLNPTFYSNNLKFYYENEDLTKNISSLNTKILEVEDKDSERFLKPAYSFNFEKKSQTDSNIGILKCQIETGKYIIHPVIMYLDAYGNEQINGWDGTQVEGIYTLDGSPTQTSGRAYYEKQPDETYSPIAFSAEKSYKANTYYYQSALFAPQMGAGEKDSYNIFTGVVMGKDGAQEKIGLYGYNQGEAAFGFKADGTGFIGKRSSGGQINFDGNTAVIYGGGDGEKVGGQAENGMTITLANLRTQGTTKAIEIGAGKFYIDYSGKLYAQNADIEGTIKATSGSIGGWDISANLISSGKGSGYIGLDSQTPGSKSTWNTDIGAEDTRNFAIWAGSSSRTSAGFAVTKHGRIYAKEGVIGGWALTTVNSNAIFTSSDKRVGMSPQHGLRFWSISRAYGTAAGFPSKPTGSLTPTTVTQLTNLRTTLGNLYGSSYFIVDDTGRVICNDAIMMGTVYAKSGYIGNWVLRSNQLAKTDGTVGMGTGTNGEGYAFWSGAKMGSYENIPLDQDIEPTFDESDTGTEPFFYVKKNGTMSCRNANIKGSVTATSGKIGAWAISNNGVLTADTQVLDEETGKVIGGGEMVLGPTAGFRYSYKDKQIFTIDNAGIMYINSNARSLTPNVSMKIYADTECRVKATEGHLRIQSDRNWVYIDGDDGVMLSGGDHNFTLYSNGRLNFDGNIIGENGAIYATFA